MRILTSSVTGSTAYQTCQESGSEPVAISNFS
jgi:hypothetical protein